MMARRRSSLSSMLSLALSVLAAVCVASSSAQQQQPPSQPLPLPPPLPAVPAVPSCPPVRASLSPCVSYFIGNSSSPPAECCSQMQAMFQSQAPCLCAALAAVPAQLGAVLGQVLPSACSLPANACATGGTSSSAPAGGSAAPSSGTTAAAASPTTVPSGTIPPSGGGSKSVPALPDSAAVGPECKGISAAAVLVASFLAAYVLCCHSYDC